MLKFITITYLFCSCFIGNCMNIDKDAPSKYMSERESRCYEKYKNTLHRYSKEQLQKDIAEAKEYAKSPDRYKWGSDFKNYRLLYPEHIKKEVAFKQEELQDLWDRQDFDTYRDMYCEKLLRLANYNAQRLMIDDDEHFTLKNRNVSFWYESIFNVPSSTFPFDANLPSARNMTLAILLNKINSLDKDVQYRVLETAAVIGFEFDVCRIHQLKNIASYRLGLYACKLFYEYNTGDFLDRIRKIARDGENVEYWRDGREEQILANALTIVKHCFKFLDDVAITEENIHSEYCEIFNCYEKTFEQLTKK